MLKKAKATSDDFAGPPGLNGSGLGPNEDKPSVVLCPCQRQLPERSTTYCFMVDLNKERALILDNFVWAVATKEIPIKEWRSNWKTVELPREKIDKMLDSLASYAIYAGATPEAMEYLPLMTPMTDAAKRVAGYKGVELLERYKTQAAIEEAAEKAGKPLTGAALIAKAKKIMADAAANEATEEHLAATVDEPETTVVAERRRTTKKAEKVRQAAAEVTEILNEAEAKGENPMKVMKTTKTADVKKEAKRVAKEEKVARAKPFDAAKLKGPDGKYKSVSSALKGLILEGKLKTDEAIFKAAQKQFPDLSDDKFGYVKWNRNWLKKEGLIS